MPRAKEPPWPSEVDPAAFVAELVAVQQKFRLPAPVVVLASDLLKQAPRSSIKRPKGVRIDEAQTCDLACRIFCESDVDKTPRVEVMDDLVDLQFVRARAAASERGESRNRLWIDPSGMQGRRR